MQGASEQRPPHTRWSPEACCRRNSMCSGWLALSFGALLEMSDFQSSQPRSVASLRLSLFSLSCGVGLHLVQIMWPPTDAGEVHGELGILSSGEGEGGGSAPLSEHGDPGKMFKSSGDMVASSIKQS